MIPPNFDYWMLNIIEENISKLPTNIGRHFGCSDKCDNKFCKVGQRNLILTKIQKIKDYYNKMFEM